MRRSVEKSEKETVSLAVSFGLRMPVSLALKIADMQTKEKRLFIRQMLFESGEIESVEA